MTSTLSGSDASLRSLRDRPFELLKALEKRSRSVAAGNTPEASAGKEWVGVAFRMGGETFLVAREETREVLGYPAAVTRIPGVKSWVKGLANVRGQLLPMVDLRQFLGSGTTASGRNTRVVVVNHREIPAGLMVDEVLGAITSPYGAERCREVPSRLRTTPAMSPSTANRRRPSHSHGAWRNII